MVSVTAFFQYGEYDIHQHLDLVLALDRELIFALLVLQDPESLVPRARTQKHHVACLHPGL